MLVPANRVVTLFVDAFTADWTKYTVQSDIEDVGPVTFILYIRDAPKGTGDIKKEEIEGSLTDVKPSDQVVYATAHPSVTLARRVTAAPRIPGFIPPIHTYSVRHADEEDFKRKGVEWRSPLKENMPIVKRKRL